MLDNLSIRERVLVLLSILAVCYVVWENFLLAPLLKSVDQYKNERLQIESQLTELEGRRIVALGLTKRNDTEKLEADIAAYKEKIARIDRKINSKIEGRVAPEHMSRLLHDILGRKRNLTLIRMKNNPPVPLIGMGKEAEGKNEASLSDKKLPVKVGIYQHSLEIELEGRYLDILDYLLALEELQWKFYWERLHMEVGEYPVMKVRITVHTFSLKEGWLSV